VALFDGDSADILADVSPDRLAALPVLVPGEVECRLARCHSAFKNALQLILDNRLNGSWHRLAEALRLEQSILQYIDTSRKPKWPLIARPDVVIHGDSITMVEPNAGAPCGSRIIDTDTLGQLFEKSPAIGGLLQRFDARRFDVLSAVAAQMRTMLKLAGESPADALVVVIEFKAEFSGDLPRLARGLRRYGIRAEAATVEDLDVSDTGVGYAGERCALLYRFAAEQPDPVGQYPLLAPLLAASRRGSVVIMDDLADAIALNKTILAVLSEELDADSLPRRLRDELMGFVPWSRVLEATYASIDGVRVDLPEWCLKDRESLVLKPGAGSGGRQVTIGCQTETSQWTAAVDEALSAGDAWLVQRLARSEPTTAVTIRNGSLVSDKTYVDYAYFAIDDIVPAGIVRKSARFGFGPSSRVVKFGPYGPVFIV
jgi:hypothetical protein